MYTHSSLALCVLKDIDAIKRIRMHRRHDPARILNRVSLALLIKDNYCLNVNQDFCTRSDEELGKGSTYISAYGNEAKVEWATKVTNILEGRAVWVDVLFVVVIDTFR